MSYGRMDRRMGELKAGVDEVLKKAAFTDKVEDKKFGTPNAVTVR